MNTEPSPKAKQAAHQQPSVTTDAILDNPNADDRVRDELELAWGIIANASGGDWEKQSKEWQDAAAKWRDRVMPQLAHRPPSLSEQPVKAQQPSAPTADARMLAAELNDVATFLPPDRYSQSKEIIRRAIAWIKERSAPTADVEKWTMETLDKICLGSATAVEEWERICDAHNLALSVAQGDEMIDLSDVALIGGIVCSFVALCLLCIGYITKDKRQEENENTNRSNDARQRDRASRDN